MAICKISFPSEIAELQIWRWRNAPDDKKLFLSEYQYAAQLDFENPKITNTAPVPEKNIIGNMPYREAVSVLDDMLPTLPMQSEMFRTALMLSYKLKNEHIDYAFEMAAESVEDG